MGKGLWKTDFDVPTIKTPKNIIEEQARILSDLTDGIVLARISEIKDNSSKSVVEKAMGNVMFGRSINLGEIAGSILQYEFFLTSSIITNYKYRAFIVEYGIEIYPATFKIDPDICKDLEDFGDISERGEVYVDDAGDLISLLERILNSNKMTTVINSLRAIN